MHVTSDIIRCSVFKNNLLWANVSLSRFFIIPSLKISCIVRNCLNLNSFLTPTFQIKIKKI